MENLTKSLRLAIKEALDMKIANEARFFAKNAADYDEAFKRLKEDFKISLKVNTDDSSRMVRIADPDNVTDEEIEKIINYYNEKYKPHLVGFENRTYHYYGEDKDPAYSGTYPVFEAPYNEMFYKEMEDYIEKKAAWYSKYGCD